MSPGPQTLKVLHLDDDPFELERVEKALKLHKVDCDFELTSTDTVEGFHTALREKPDLILLDIHITENKKDGLSLLDEIAKVKPKPVVIMCSNSDDAKTITNSLRLGADDFVSKNADRGDLSHRIYSSYCLARLKAPASSDFPGFEIIGDTMKRVGARVPRIVDSAVSAVFISGESGTGKEVVADLFKTHLKKSGPFVKVNCGAIAPTLLESELFGHVKGAFTGATTDKRGLLQAADGGWIFLDEVATLSSSAQVALLRVLENQEVIRVGSTQATPISIRFLSATNEPLEKMVKQGDFRGDLWQRLRESEVSLSPLRERPKEIPQFIKHFLKAMTKGPYTMTKPAMEVLVSASWQQGNIRELRNCLRAMTEMHVNKELTPVAIPKRIWAELDESPEQSDGHQAKETTESQITVSWPKDEPVTYDRLQDLALLELIRLHAKSRGKMSLRSLASVIGMSRSTLSGRLKAMVQKEVIALKDLSALVGVSEV